MIGSDEVLTLNKMTIQDNKVEQFDNRFILISNYINDGYDSLILSKDDVSIDTYLYYSPSFIGFISLNPSYGSNKKSYLIGSLRSSAIEKQTKIFFNIYLKKIITFTNHFVDNTFLIQFLLKNKEILLYDGQNKYSGKSFNPNVMFSFQTTDFFKKNFSLHLNLMHPNYPNVVLDNYKIFPSFNELTPKFQNGQLKGSYNITELHFSKLWECPFHSDFYCTKPYDSKRLKFITNDNKKDIMIYSNFIEAQHIIESRNCEIPSCNLGRCMNNKFGSVCKCPKCYIGLHCDRNICKKNEEIPKILSQYKNIIESKTRKETDSTFNNIEVSKTKNYIRKKFSKLFSLYIDGEDDIIQIIEFYDSKWCIGANFKNLDTFYIGRYFAKLSFTISILMVVVLCQIKALIYIFLVKLK